MTLTLEEFRQRVGVSQRMIDQWKFQNLPFVYLGPDNKQVEGIDVEKAFDWLLRTHRRTEAYRLIAPVARGAGA